MINPSDIAFVIQGAIGHEEKLELFHTLARLRALAPGSQIVVSTWRGTDVEGLTADQVVYSDDPGPLHSVRPDGPFQNNVNRQIVSTRAGLAAADRPYAIKLRSDSALEHLEFLRLYAAHGPGEGEEGRILTACFFTVDPFLFEQVPYHVSDWFQFGRIEALRLYWSAELMSVEDSVYYGSHPYAPHSTYIDRRFFCRFPTEQHLAIQYAGKLGYLTPEYHNDIRPEVMGDHRRFIGERLIIADLEQIGLLFPKYDWVRKSGFQRLNCISFIDWLGLWSEAGHELTTEQESAVAARKRRKEQTRALFLAVRPLWPLLASRAARVTVNRVLRTLFFR